MFTSKLLRALVVLAASGTGARATVTLEIIGTPPQVNMAEHQGVLYVAAKGGVLTSVKCWVSALVPDRGDPAPLGSLDCSVPEKIDPSKIELVTLSASPNNRPKRGNYTATLQILGLDSTNAAVTQSTTLKLLFPAASIKLSDSDTLRIRITRSIPFWPAAEAVPVTVRVTSDLAPTVLRSVSHSELYIPNGTLKDIVPGGSLKGEFCTLKLPQAEPWYSHLWKGVGASGDCADGTKAQAGEAKSIVGLSLLIEPVVPSNIKEASGTLHLQSKEFQSDLDVPVTLLVKDWWLYAAMAVFLGQLLSFWVNNWINVGRQRKLNTIALYPVEAGLTNLLVSRSDLISSPDVATVNSLLDNAAQSNRLGDVEGALTSIKTAQDKLTILAATPVAASPTQPPAPTLFLLQKNAYAHRQLNFAVLNPDKNWPLNAVYKWESKPEKFDWRLLYEAQDLKAIVVECRTRGTYAIRLSVDGKDITSYAFTVEKDTSTALQWQIAQRDKAVLLLAVIFAAILSYLAIDQLQTFGTVSDYALAFLGGFGLNSTTSGFSAVLARFGASPQGTGPAKP